MKQKLLIIELMLTESYSYSGKTNLFESAGWKLYLSKKAFGRLKTIADQISALSLNQP